MNSTAADVPCGELQRDGFISSNHFSWVCKEPEFHMVLPSPRASKKLVSSAVAPVIAKFAPRVNVAFFAFDGGSKGRPNSWAEYRKKKSIQKNKQRI